MSSVILHLITALFLLSLVSCGNPNESSSSLPKNPEIFPQETKGTSDGGGGIVVASTKEEVHEAILNVRRTFANELNRSDFNIGLREFTRIGFNANSKTIRANLNRVYSVNIENYSSKIDELKLHISELKSEIEGLREDRDDVLSTPREELLEEILEAGYKEHELDKKIKGELDRIKSKINSIHAEIDKLEDGEYPEHMGLADDFGSFINGISLTPLLEGSCSANNKDHADASVSENTRSASICFSLDNLARLPKHTLYEQIAS